jgi:hypothetical protein
VTPRIELLGSLAISAVLLGFWLYPNNPSSSTPPSPESAVCEIAPGGGPSYPPYQSK